MDFENSPSLPHAHQQIRLGDIQASAQRWARAIECYLRAIEYFKTIQKSLYDTSLISNIQAQIRQCEKAIDFYHLKDRFEQNSFNNHHYLYEQAMKSERHSTITRAHSISNTKPSTTLNRTMPRYYTQQFDNAVVLGGRDEMDSFAALIFPHSNPESLTKTRSSLMAKKNRKDDSEKMEELQMSYEALKNHHKVAFDYIERLKNENNELRFQREVISSQQLIEFSALSTSHEGKDKEIERTR
ncbi:unnamed protein product [Rotaria magnacalcarata]|uniref:MIT domain-containing protein n=1 Tax=Rotaria magnacalcarata TaxID=392030 RepID=A0A816SW24_9BILA|nr:unnamed protein product [Rotaria magnacalcarata]